MSQDELEARKAVMLARSKQRKEKECAHILQSILNVYGTEQFTEALKLLEDPNKTLCKECSPQ